MVFPDLSAFSGFWVENGSADGVFSWEIGDSNVGNGDFSSSVGVSLTKNGVSLTGNAVF